MAFVKLVKNTAYFKRYQTQFRRRREGKTDYYARKRLILQDKDKYNTPKYRLVGRVSNRYVIAQIVYSTLKGDRVLSSATSREFKRWGVNAGLSSYPAAYSTGLLLARRLLKELKMDTLYPGVNNITGEKTDVSENANDERRPFKAVLDVGLARTTVGNRVFSILKGATDGGLYVPHSVTRFPGQVVNPKSGAKEYKPAVHRDRIFGKHIDNYMKTLKTSNAEVFKRQFSKLNQTLTDSKVESVEKLYTKLHESIRKNPEKVKAQPKANPKRDHVKLRQKKLTLKQRKERQLKKIELLTKEHNK